MNHDKAKKHFLALSDDSLAPGLKSELEDHLSACESCTEDYLGFLNTIKLSKTLANQEYVQSPDFAVTVMEKIEGLETEKHRRLFMKDGSTKARKIFSPLLSYGLATSFVVVISLASVTFLGEQASQTFSEIGSHLGVAQEPFYDMASGGHQPSNGELFTRNEGYGGGSKVLGKPSPSRSSTADGLPAKWQSAHMGTMQYSNPALANRSSKNSGIWPLRSASHVVQDKANTEAYNPIYEADFLPARSNPLSTFSIDVDTASYSNLRRYLNGGARPPKDAVRIEELVNYFDYDYPQPDGAHPFSVSIEASQAPWNLKHQLVHIGLQGKNIATDNLPASNLVFLLDVSGSMNQPDKLPLLKKAFKLLVSELRENDRVAIVVYAGSSGIVLPSTLASDKSRILAALERLSAGGGTAGAAGIELAYKTAEAQFIQGGNNRIILATDGDFNLGQSSDAELVRIIEEKRKKGVFLTVLGFGTGNYKDSKMEQLANKGNGNFAYIDSLLEAKKVLVKEMGGTLFTIAKDVKIQVEFNPGKVSAYRLLGYENRMLKKEDFNNDKKDAGELGAGHTVTALYEIVPVGVEIPMPSVDALKYQTPAKVEEAIESNSDELLTVKLRYKEPAASESELISVPFVDQNTELAETSNNFKFSAAVAEFGMLLRDSKFKSSSSYDQVRKLANQGRGKDEFGYRGEFIRMVEAAELLANQFGTPN